MKTSTLLNIHESTMSNVARSRNQLSKTIRGELNIITDLLENHASGGLSMVKMAILNERKHQIKTFLKYMENTI